MPMDQKRLAERIELALEDPLFEALKTNLGAASEAEAVAAAKDGREIRFDFFPKDGAGERMKAPIEALAEAIALAVASTVASAVAGEVIEHIRQNAAITVPLGVPVTVAAATFTGATTASGICTIE